MNWIELNDLQQLEQIKEQSKLQPVVIFKHSTRCSISSMAKIRLEQDPLPEGTLFYYLDLIAYRPISGQIAEDFNVYHQSPQILVIKNGECTFNVSHYGISVDKIVAETATINPEPRTEKETLPEN